MMVNTKVDKRASETSIITVEKLKHVKQESQKNLFAKVSCEKKLKVMKKEMKNPLMKTMKAMIRQGVDLKVQMPPNQILE